MTKTIVLSVALLAAGASAGYFAFSASGSSDASSGHDSDVVALRHQVESLSKELQSLKQLVSEIPASSLGAPSSARESVHAPSAVGNSAVAVVDSTALTSMADRNAVFALIKEERELREKEKQDKQKLQVRQGVAKRLESTGKRVGLGDAETASVVSLWMKSLDREDDIRKAYPTDGLEDPLAEKRRLELEAARTDRDASIAGLIPDEKQDEWDRSTRMLRRAGSFMEGMAAFGDFPMGDFGGGGRGSMMFSGDTGGGGRGTGGGGNNQQGGGGGMRQRRNGETATNGPGAGSAATEKPKNE